MPVAAMLRPSGAPSPPSGDKGLCEHVAPQHDLCVLLCPALGKLRLTGWLALPVLFLFSVAGVAAALFAGTGSDNVALSTPLLFGCAVAVTLLTSGNVAWRRARWKHATTGTYVLTLLMGALTLDGLQLPVPETLAVGAVGIAALGLLLFRNRSRGPCPARKVTVRELSCHR
ncbi:hypothetical protein GIY23_18150 [Allosaccharopolyspora coralli]|uniref:Uncharacterized protein n=1 Tax=Allosaccharopolyspora coralli TaxID=2665642 RepID=A0A5Q3QK42_9PSEU|nr:hypothetical protein [Allosaccharopolyspora coralli]QGK71187.1 hypothetical protein GIY23_18150 [Allosaccharopolyspora coralli]